MLFQRNDQGTVTLVPENRSNLNTDAALIAARQFDSVLGHGNSFDKIAPVARNALRPLASDDDGW
jgi:hypothetical protein